MNIKKIAFLAVIFQFTITAPTWGLTVISDIDDTIKVTGVNHDTDAVVRALFSKRSFAGMTEVYNALDTRSVIFTYLSASPEFMGIQMAQFLEWNHFPEGDLLLRPLSELQTPIAEYKFKLIDRLLSRSADTYLLIGDDTQSDALVYDLIAKKYPNQVLGIYIHQVQGAKIPEGQKAFLTSFDLALALYYDQHVALEDVEMAKTVLTIQKNSNKIIPKFQICPKDYTPVLFSSESVLINAAAKVQNLVRKICAKRS